ncbi:dTMP kinase [Neisseria leonii]|uniref:dTMP kinase n=1 Tax=Neisseria leonii TaxID=2995413 RepID=UPI0030CC9F21
MARARFITLDGMDGAGKSTNLAVIKDWFEANRLPVLFTREPGGTALGEALRGLLLDPATRCGLRSETLLMFAARQEHLAQVILPALQKGIHVVSDRFTDATFAYQGGGRGVPAADIEILENWVQGGLRPDLTLLLDVPTEIAIQRVAAVREKDRFEQEEAAFFGRVRQAYLDRAAAAPECYAVIRSDLPPEDVRRQVEQALVQAFSGWQAV